MLVMYGPHNRSYLPVDPPDSLAFRCDVDTLGQAIWEYERAFGVTITPHDASAGLDLLEADERPKYFVYASTLASGEREEFLVDIHVERLGEEICPKQDLTFRLLRDDVVQIWTGMVC
jgi:hypothetical protein